MACRRAWWWALLALGYSTASQAQTIDDGFWFQAAGYYASVDSSAQVSEVGGSELGTVIDLENDLGFDDSEWLPSVTAGWRVSENLVLVGEFYRLGRNSSATLDREIIIEDVTYPVNGTITAGFDSDIYRLTLGWSFLRNDNYELGAALGLHATRFDLFIEGEGEVDGVEGQFTTRQYDVLAPLPTIGIYGLWEVAPRVTVGGRFDYLSLKVGDYDGRLINTQATVSYRVTKNIGIGALYRFVDYRVEVEKETYFGRLDYEYSGPAVFLEVGF